jgi:ATP-dependent protease ClpP protease subunit
VLIYAKINHMPLLYQNKWTAATMEANNTKAVIKVEGYIGVPRHWYWDETMRNDIVATKEEMAKEIKSLKNLKVTEIDVLINSYGGDVNHGIAMYEALVMSGATINVRIHGFTASIATVISMAAPFERRKASVNSMMLVHQARGGEQGTASAIRSYADWLEKINDQIADIYVKGTKLTKEAAIELMNRVNGEGEWLTAAEMKTMQFIADTFEPLEAAASFESEINACGFLPQLPTATPPVPPKPDVLDKLNAKIDGMVESIKGLFPNNSLKPDKNMSKLALVSLCAALAVTGIEVTDDGAYFNEDQLKTIDAAIKAANDKLATALAAEKTAQEALTAAQNERKTVMDAIDTIDATVVAAATPEAKVLAIKTKLAEKPGASGSNHSGGDGGKPSADGADWDAINALPHNQAVDKMIL